MIRVMRGLWMHPYLPLRTIATFTNFMQQPTGSNRPVLPKRLLVDVPLTIQRGFFTEKKEDNPPEKK